MERYRHALRPWLSHRRPGPDDTVVAVRVAGVSEAGSGAAGVSEAGSGLAGGSEASFDFCLAVDPYGTLACWTTDLPDAAVRLRTTRSVVDDVVSGRVAGSGAVMSDRVGIDGDRDALRRFAAVARTEDFQGYVAALGDAFARHPSSARGMAAPRPSAVRAEASGPAAVVAVFGAPNGVDGELGVAARGRCAAAIALCHADPAATLVLSGGFGKQFNTSPEPHWLHCRRWIERRYGPERPPFAAYLDSRHTYDDVLLLREYLRLRPARSVTAVTSDFHVPRVRFLLDVALPEAVIHVVANDDLGAAELDARHTHERGALAKTVAGVLLFGVDRLPDGLAPIIDRERESADGVLGAS